MYFNLLGEVCRHSSKTSNSCFLNSLKYAKCIHLSINIAAKAVMLVIEEELFLISAFFSFCKGFWLHANPKPHVVIVRHDISPSVIDAQ